ncbi:MAG: hypothetical protein IMZ53_12860 [Thermoplasmata archaeon]|nr:hypothetical protein [Thermoplasmata archaeon]
MKLTDLRVHDLMSDHTEGEFVPEAIQVITDSRWNHSKTISRIVEPTPDGIFISESIGEGFKERTLRESTGRNDVETVVSRYCADGVGGKEITPEQSRLMTVWDSYYLSKGITYGYAQIVALAFLKQIENDSVAGMYLERKLEDIQVEIEKFYPQFICSESTYRKFNESGLDLGIIKDSAHLSHYSGGDILERYKAGGKDVFNPVIADWLSPHQIFMSQRAVTLDSLDYNWR